MKTLKELLRTIFLRDRAFAQFITTFIVASCSALCFLLSWLIFSHGSALRFDELSDMVGAAVVTIFTGALPILMKVAVSAQKLYHETGKELEIAKMGGEGKPKELKLTGTLSAEEVA